MWSVSQMTFNDRRFWEQDLKLDLRLCADYFARVHHQWFDKLSDTQKQFLRSKIDTATSDLSVLFPYFLLQQLNPAPLYITIQDVAQTVLSTYQCAPYLIQQPDKYDRYVLLWLLFDVSPDLVQRVYHMDRVHRYGFARYELIGAQRKPAVVLNSQGFTGCNVIGHYLHNDYDWFLIQHADQDKPTVIGFNASHPYIDIGGLNLEQGIGYVKTLFSHQQCRIQPLYRSNKAASIRFFLKQCTDRQDLHINLLTFDSAAPALQYRSHMTIADSGFNTLPQFPLNHISPCLGTACLCFDHKNVKLSFQQVPDNTNSIYVFYTDYVLTQPQRYALEQWMRRTYALELLPYANMAPYTASFTGPIRTACLPSALLD